MPTKNEIVDALFVASEGKIRHPDGDDALIPNTTPESRARQYLVMTVEQAIIRARRSAGESWGESGGRSGPYHHIYSEQQTLMTIEEIRRAMNKDPKRGENLRKAGLTADILDSALERLQPQTTDNLLR